MIVSIVYVHYDEYTLVTLVDHQTREMTLKNKELITIMKMFECLPLTFIRRYDELKSLHFLPLFIGLYGLESQGCDSFYSFG